MRKLLHYLKPYGFTVIWGAFLLLLTQLTTMAVPQIFRWAVDDLQGDASLEFLQQLALALLLLAAAGAVFRVLSRRCLLFAARDIENDLRNAFYRHLTQHPPSFFHRRRAGDLMSRATNDLTQIRLLVGPGILNLINTIIAYLTAIPLMFMVSPSLTAISLGIYVPSLFLVQVLSRTLYRRNKSQQEQLGELSSFIQENIAGAHVVRAFGMEQVQAERFDVFNQEYYTASVRLAFSRSYLWRMLAGFASLSGLVVLYFGALQVMAGTISLGDLVALVEYLALLAWPSFALGWVLSLWQRGSAAFSRIDEILSEAPTVVGGQQNGDNLCATVHVASLSAKQGERYVLRDINFALPKGATLGIVGPVGSGKSALIHALVRERDISSGHIHIGGVAIQDLDLNGLRRMFGFVHQEPFLFSRTIAENVAFGRPGAELTHVLEAIEIAALKKDLNTLPKGHDTPVGERGITLSGGQKQRVAIARAILLNPPILVLDDALSSVDAQTETEILDALCHLRQDRSTIIVAHRVSAVQHASEILVLKEGVVAERGTHQQLIDTGGLYADMAQRQALERDLAVHRDRSA